MRVLVILLSLSFATNSLAADFRDTTWGMNREEVTKIETATRLNENEIVKNKPDCVDVLVYEDKVLGTDVKIFYQFVDSQLIAGIYRGDLGCEYKEILVEAIKFAGSLKNIYGNPEKDDGLDTKVTWKNDIPHYDVVWELERTTITIRFQNKICPLWVIMYKSKLHPELFKKAVKARTKGKL